MLISSVGSNFGFMWGALISDENQSVTSSIVYMLVSSLGAGQFINLGNPGMAVTFLANISPMRYAVERIFRRIISGNPFGGAILEVLSFNVGDQESTRILVMTTLLFFVLGWFFLVYKASKF